MLYLHDRNNYVIHTHYVHENNDQLWIDYAFHVCSLHLFPSPLAGGASLGPRDLGRLYNFLKLAAPGWRKIGGALDFTYVELKAITPTIGLAGNDDYFQELLHLWLKRTPDRTTKEILAGALKSAGEGRLAEELLKNF